MSHCYGDDWCGECVEYMTPAEVVCSAPEFRFVMLRLCRACDNEARYDSGYCGLHDIELNEGKGVRLSDVLATP
jgi:hypothetical protein